MCRRWSSSIDQRLASIPPFSGAAAGAARQAAPGRSRCWRGALGRVAAGAEQALGLQSVVAADAAVAAVAVAAVVEGGVGADVLQAEQHAPASRRVARVGDEIGIERQSAPSAYVPPLAQKQARPFHGHPPVACQHGSHPLSRAHKKGAARPWNKSTDAPRPDGVKISAAKTDSARLCCLSVCLSDYGTASPAVKAAE